MRGNARIVQDKDIMTRLQILSHYVLYYYIVVLIRAVGCLRPSGDGCTIAILDVRHLIFL